MLISDLTNTQLMLLVLPVIPNMWALKHALYHDFPTEKEKYRWMMACIFLPCVAGIAYFFVGRKRASKDKIDVFERYKKETPADRRPDEDGTAAATAMAVGESAASPAGNEAPVDPEDELVYENRARAPWDADPEEQASSAEAPAAPAEPEQSADVRRATAPRGEWDFGCPDDSRKN